MNQQPQCEYLVLGIGSPHGDDQAGWLVASALRRLGVVRSYSLRDAAQILDHIENHGRAIIVDACRSQSPPGDIHRFTWPDDRLLQHKTHSTHSADVATILEMAVILHRMPQEVIFYGIEVGDCRPNLAVSESVKQAAEIVAERIREEMRRPLPASHA